MPDYRFDSFNTRSFEQLIQGLSLVVLSPGITPFGDGRDGGREATFDGPVQYWTDGAQWDGYGVIQAKFLQRPLGTEKDGKWAISQLQSELADYEKADTVRRIPEYYVFATNATLSAVQDVGTKDLLLAELTSFAQRHNLRGYDVWDYDKLRLLLDSHPLLRSTYDAWLLPGDVLSAVIAQAQGYEPDFDRLMIKLLQRELVDNQFANLEQAGDSADGRVPLASVFVDIPYTRVRGGAEVENEPDGLAVADIYASAQCKLDAATRAAAGHTRPDEDCYVLIGGPGQGKTTVAQFMCQLFRAALVRELPPHRLVGEVASALGTFEKQLADQAIPAAGVRRFPMHVVLNELAHFLAHASEEEFSIASFLAKKMTKRLGSPVKVKDLRRWLVSYPSFMVLDGLDEVPASTNREDVMRVISEFLLDAKTDNADMLVLATSRPQGYSAEFRPESFNHLFLSPLSDEDALRYGRKLVHVKYGENSDRGHAIEARLVRAVSEESVSHLMRSPLQVTIMALLVERVGQPPKERYTLFSEYYSVIYARELGRDIPAATLLRDYKTDIDSIHWRVGLALQVRSEVKGGTESRLTRDEFSNLVRGRLQEEEHQGLALETLVQSITEAAAERLVFIVGHETDAIGFEIRSLQEFMAAEALHEGAESDVQERLRAIAPAVHWRNVFLFAAGRCFTKTQSLRDTIIAICSEMNNAMAYGEINAYLRRGSDLALEVLLDGSVRFQPKYIRSLLGLASGVIGSPGASSHADLAAAALELKHESLLLEEVDRLAVFPDHGALRLAIVLAEAGNLSCQDRIDALVAESPTQALTVLRAALALDAYTFIGPRVPGLLAHVKPLRTRVGSTARLTTLLEEFPDWVGGCIRFLGLPSGTATRASRANLSPSSKRDRLSFYYWSIDSPASPYASWADVPDAYISWAPLNAVAGFVRNPSVANLGAAFEEILEQPEKTLEATAQYSPWPLAALLYEDRSTADRILEDLLAGEYGDETIWRAAEERWRRGGIDYADLGHSLERRNGRPFDSEIATLGFPLFLRHSLSYRAPDVDPSDELVALYFAAAPGRSRRVFGDFLTRMVESKLLRDPDHPLGGVFIKLLDARLANADGMTWAVADPQLETLSGLMDSLDDATRDDLYSKAAGGALRQFVPPNYRPGQFLRLAQDVSLGFSRSGGSLGHLALLIRLAERIDVRPVLPSGIDLESFGESALARKSLALFRLIQDGPDAALPGLRKVIVGEVWPEELAILCNAILLHQGYVLHARESLLFALAKVQHTDPAETSNVALVLRDVVRGRQSGMEEAKRCADLGLPTVISDLSHDV
jgi:hypothetical protein